MKRTWRAKKRLFILSLDGVPYSFLQAGIAAGRFSHLGRLGKMVKITSVLPPVSSAAWATFSTGVNPGRHGILGFLDREPVTMRERIPTASDLNALTLWEMLNEAGKRTIAMNVPLTYPPQEVDGIMISGFLCTDLTRGVSPTSLLSRLRQLDYQIDPDPSLATTDRERYLAEIFATFHGRRRALAELIEERWDLFMCHVMMTDRINHFFWADGEDENAEFHAKFWEFYDEVDALVGEVEGLLPGKTDLLVLSDHGFCRLKQEVDLNAYLAEGGFLRFKDAGEGLARIDPSSRTYSLLPGRIYINLVGREGIGAVRGADYDPLRADLMSFLKELKEPQGDPILKKILPREEVYSGVAAEHAPDLVALPYDGYDLKARFSPGPCLTPALARSGMHTHPDAFATLRGGVLRNDGSLQDLTPVIFQLLGLPVPSHLEGSSLLEDREGGRG